MEVKRYATPIGGCLFRIPLEVAPQFVAHVHLIVHGDSLTLVDTGSANSRSTGLLLRALQHIEERFGVPVRSVGPTRVVLTHGHADHCGGVSRLREEYPGFELWAHPLAVPSVVKPHERAVLYRMRLARFLATTGVPSRWIESLSKCEEMGERESLETSVEKRLAEGSFEDPPFEVFHVPGHAPGLIMLKIGDLLLTSDHVISDTSVLVVPESVRSYCGVGHYLESLSKAMRIGGVRTALAGHGAQIAGYYDKVKRAESHVLARLQQVLDICSEPTNINDVATRMYGSVEGPNALLRLQQLGARVEYLHERAYLEIVNYEQNGEALPRAPYLYRRIGSL